MSSLLHPTHCRFLGEKGPLPSDLIFLLYMYVDWDISHLTLYGLAEAPWVFKAPLSAGSSRTFLGLSAPTRLE